MRIKQDGWRQVRMRGDHRIFHHSDKPGIVVVSGNLVNDVPIGLLSKIWKQAGLGGTP